MLIVSRLMVYALLAFASLQASQKETTISQDPQATYTKKRPAHTPPYQYLKEAKILLTSPEVCCINLENLLNLESSLRSTVTCDPAFLQSMSLAKKSLLEIAVFIHSHTLEKVPSINFFPLFRLSSIILLGLQNIKPEEASYSHQKIRFLVNCCKLNYTLSCLQVSAPDQAKHLLDDLQTKSTQEVLNSYKSEARLAPKKLYDLICSEKSDTTTLKKALQHSLKNTHCSCYLFSPRSKIARLIDQLELYTPAEHDTINIAPPILHTAANLLPEQTLPSPLGESPSFEGISPEAEREESPSCEKHERGDTPTPTALTSEPPLSLEYSDDEQDSPPTSPTMKSIRVFPPISSHEEPLHKTETTQSIQKQPDPVKKVVFSVPPLLSTLKDLIYAPLNLHGDILKAYAKENLGYCPKFAAEAVWETFSMFRQITYFDKLADISQAIAELFIASHLMPLPMDMTLLHKVIETTHSLFYHKQSYANYPWLEETYLRDCIKFTCTLNLIRHTPGLEEKLPFTTQGKSITDIFLAINPNALSLKNISTLTSQLLLAIKNTGTRTQHTELLELCKNESDVIIAHILKRTVSALDFHNSGIEGISVLNTPANETEPEFLAALNSVFAQNTVEDQQNTELEGPSQNPLSIWQNL